MAIDTIERLYKLTVDGAAALRSLKEIERSTSSLDKQMADTINGVKKFATALGGAFIAREIVNGIRGIIDSFDDLSKDAQKVGLAVEELQKLRYAADLSGLGAEKMNAAMTRLSQAMGNLGEKGDKAAGVLRKFGVKEGDDTATALGKVADAFAKMPDGMAKTAAAADLFGKKIGPDMIPLLNSGSAALEELTDQAKTFGGIVSGKTVKAAEEFNDNISRIGRTAAGIGAQFTAGMLPALVAVSKALTEAAKDAGGFEGAGQKMGERIISLTSMSLRFTATLQQMGIVFSAIAEAGVSGIWSDTRKRIDAQMNTDLNTVDRVLAQRLAALKSDFKRAQEAFPENPLPTKPGKDDDDPLKAAAAAEKAAREKEKREKEAGDALERRLKFEKEMSDAVAKSNAVQTDAERIATAMTQARIDTTKASEAHSDALRVEEARLDRLVELFETGSPEVKAWAAAQLVATRATNVSTETMVKQRDALDVLGESFTTFLDDAASSAGHLEDAFKKMVQTVITGLLQILAKKYILDIVASFLGINPGTGKPAATGAVFDAGKVVPFARGGVISRPIVFPMAMAGEAGPEAILPLRRAADGNLGVQAQAAQLNITINNNAGVEVTTRRTGPNDLEVIVERARAAVAADLRTGGNLVSRSLEQAYGIGRGAAAAF